MGVWTPVVLAVLAIAGCTHALTKEDFGPTPENKAYAEKLKELLPSDVAKQLHAIYEDKSLTSEQVAEKSFELWTSLPEATREKLPLPPAIERLPADVRQKAKEIIKKPGLTSHQRFEEVLNFLKEA